MNATVVGVEWCYGAQRYSCGGDVQMNASKFLLGSFALILASSLASAADMPTRIPVRAPVVAPPPVAAWTGCYIGGNIGGGWAGEKNTDPLAGVPCTIFRD